MQRKNFKWHICILNIFASLLCILVFVICALVFLSRQHPQPKYQPASDFGIMDSYDGYISEQFLQAEDAARSVPKRFWLPEDAQKGPVPNPECYGTSDNPASLGWLLEDASLLLDGQRTLFTTETEIKPGSEVIYYLDESIFTVTWKQIINNFVYTISEIKISHPSQFRRHLAGGYYNSGKLYFTTVMAESVNAVVGTSADHYKGRDFGICVYDGEVKRFKNPGRADVCYIDRNGDLIFSYHGEFTDWDEAQKFVDDHDIQFSISFGPILIDNGIQCDPDSYPIGEIKDRYARAALCQMDSLHYLVVAANTEGIYCRNQTIRDFASNLASLGCQKAYTLDGGNTAAIAVDGKLINRTAFGYQRSLSDIIYFATAIPENTH